MLLFKKILQKLKSICIKIKNIFLLIIGFILFLKKKKIVFMIDGGLGSQMWQYAIGQAIEKKSGMPVVYDLFWYKNDGKDCMGENNRNWDLEKVFFNIKVNRANICEIYFYKKFLNKKYTSDNRVNFFIDEILTSPKPRYLGEYYNDVKYFDFIENYLRKSFVFNTAKFSNKTMQTAEDIKKTNNSVALQVRRGDFVTVGADKTTPPEYFYKAIERNKQLLNNNKLTYFVFSNDIPYCKKIFSFREEKFVFVDINDNDNGAQDMYLMSLCRHFIISASSFGWWGAFLSPIDENKIVITPEKWRTYELSEEKGKMLMDGWIGV